MARNGRQPVELDKAIEIAKNYFENKEVPKTTREWRHNCPPELTAGKINSLSFTVGDVLRAINPLARKPKAESIVYDLGLLGFSTLVFNGTNGTYTCSRCGDTKTSPRSSILAWLKSGAKYCSTCRGSSGIPKSADYYSTFLPENYSVLQVLPEAGNTRLVIKHEPCGNITTYSSRHILNSDREYLYCSYCEGLAGYDSKQEKLIVEHILATYPLLGIKTQVKYRDLVDTNRKYILDVFIPELNLALEITTKGNGFENYFQNLSNKIELLKSSNYICKVVYSTSQVDDIVRSLLKDKEKS